jgi:hypothetical protein
MVFILCSHNDAPRVGNQISSLYYVDATLCASIVTELSPVDVNRLALGEIVTVLGYYELYASRWALIMFS